MKRKHLYAGLIALAFAAAPVSIAASEEDDAADVPVTDTAAGVSAEPVAAESAATGGAEAAEETAGDAAEDAGDAAEDAGDAAEDAGDAAEDAGDAAEDAAGDVAEDSAGEAEDADGEAGGETEAGNTEDEKTGTYRTEDGELVTDRDIEGEKAAFLEDLLADGYAEVGDWKVENIRDNIYHMDEERLELKGGDYDEDGVMNNPSSIYFVVEEDSLLIVDGGNRPGSDLEKLIDAKVICEALAGQKEVTMVFTHGHVDHVGLTWDKEILENLNFAALYINEKDYINKVENSLYAEVALEAYADKVVFIDDGESFEVGGKTYQILAMPGHTEGSIIIYNYDNNVVFSGDAMGSGFVWLFWDNIDNPIGTMEAGLNELSEIVKNMENPVFLCGHRWQQFWEGNAERPGEMTVQYINDMLKVISGLKDGTTIYNDYALRGRDTDIELSSTGAKAKIDTIQSVIDMYLESVNAYDKTEIFVFDHSADLSIYSENNNAAAVFFIYGDGNVSSEDAAAYVKDTGIEDIITRSASKAIWVNPANGESFTEEDAALFLDIMDNMVFVSMNVKLIGIGEGATFVNEYLSQYDWMLSGLMTVGGEAGTTPKYSVPAYISGENAAEVAEEYIKANNTVKVSEEGTVSVYVNPDSRFEIVVVNTAEEDDLEAFANAWDLVLSRFARIGNINRSDEGTGTWYSKANSVEREFQYFDSVEAITNMNREVVVYDLDGDGQNSLWYEYVPEEVVNAEEGTVPVVILLHGNTNDPRTQYDTSGWANIASEEGIILICPEWQGHTFNGYEYQPMTEDDNTTPDSDFITMLKLILDKYPQIDASRVYLSGLSRGSRNTTTNALVNTQYFAAGAGQSGPFFLSDEYYDNVAAAVEANKDQYDMPIIFFSGDKDEYMLNWDELVLGQGLQITQFFQILNDMDVTQVEDLKKEFQALYGVEWDNFGYVDNEGLCRILGGSITNDKGVTISMNRIEDWGHWNYPAATRLMWEFMKQYARDLETGEIILLSEIEEPEIPVIPVTPDQPEKPEKPDRKPGRPAPGTGIASAAVSADTVNTAAEFAPQMWTLAGTLSGLSVFGLLKKKKEEE